MTAYEVRISDWSSDVCSSDLSARGTVRPLIAMGLVITALMVLGWGTFFVIVLPGQYLMGGQTVFGTGLALTAFTLGLRHGFDPDHIAAIDNTTRRSEEHTSELQSLMRISYAVFCWKKKKNTHIS